MMRFGHLRRSAAALLAGIVAATATARADDTVHLKSGAVLSGKILEETDQAVTIQIGGGTSTIPRSEIKAVRRSSATAAGTASSPPPSAAPEVKPASGGSTQAPDSNGRSRPETPAYRCLVLLPLASPLACALAVPEDFTVAPAEGDTPDLAMGVFWGRAATVEKLRRDPEHDLSKIDSPVFVVRLSTNVAQTEDGGFSGMENLEEKLAAQGIKDPRVEKGNWGPYPYLVLETTRPDGIRTHLAWIGLNYETLTLMVDYRHPRGEGRPNDEDLRLWRDFLEKTQVLPEPDFSRCHGYDRRPGCTDVEKGTLRYSIAAERRKSDGKLAVHVEASSGDTVIEVSGDVKTDVWEGKPIVLVQLSAAQPNEIWNENVAVLLNDVEELATKGQVIQETARMTLSGGPGVTLVK